MKISTLVLSLVFALAACKGDDNGKAAKQPPAKPDPAATPAPGPAAPTPTPAAGDERVGGKVACGLMTKEEASKLVGATLGEGKASDLNCTWSEGMNIVILEIRPASQFAMAKQMAKEMEEDKFEELTGVGDEAFYGAIAGHHVVFRVGDRYAQLGMVSSAPEGKQATIDFAKTLASRL